MAGEHGVKELKEMLTFSTDLAEGIEDLVADWKLNAIPVVMRLAASAPLAFEGLKALGDEAAELDEADRAELKEHFKTELDLDDDKAEKWVEFGMGVAISLAGMVELLREAKA